MFLGGNLFIHPASVLLNQSTWANMTAQFCRCWVCFYGQHVQSHSILSSDLLATHCPDFRGNFKGCETSSSILIPRGGLASLSSRGRCRSALREEPRSRVCWVIIFTFTQDRHMRPRFPEWLGLCLCLSGKFWKKSESSSVFAVSRKCTSTPLKVSPKTNVDRSSIWFSDML